MLLDELYPIPSRQRLRPSSLLARLLSPADSPSVQQRDWVDRVLLHAQQQGWLEHATRQRLASGDDTVMLAALNELGVAHFLHRRGAQLELNPPGRGRHVGEFMVWFNTSSLFLEVKTLIAPQQDIYRSEAERAIGEAASGLDLPLLLEIELQACPISGVSIRDLRFYLQLAAQQLLDGGHEPPAYKHRSGLCLRVLRAALLGPDHAGPPVIRFADWPLPAAVNHVGAEERWRERLLRALRGAYDQVPAPAQASLVVVVDQGDQGAALQSWLSALNGSFLRPGQHRRLGAIARFDTLLSPDEVVEQLSIIHNPWATQPLAAELLLLPQVQQLSPIPRSDDLPR